ncbi:MAG: response regulator [Herpetosiphon sp.]|nr:response regulator [Herpetosiphon sp.]
MNTILVVDDDPAILSGITILLEQAGYHVLQASNGADARRLLANKPDLVILDIMLPDDDGIELCRVIRQQTHDTPVLMNQYITIKHQH